MRSLVSGLAVVAAVTISTGCKKGSDAPPGPTHDSREADELWKLGPANSGTGIVATPAGLAMVESAVGSMRALFAKDPTMAELQAQLQSAITSAFGHDIASFTDVGIDRTKGLAMFLPKDGGRIIVLALSDRQKFVTAFQIKDGGADHLGDLTCKPFAGRLACASDAKLLDGMGKGAVPPMLLAVGSRGELEGANDQGPLTGAFVAQLERGQFVMRGKGVTTLPPEVASIGKAAKPRLDAGTTVGFIAIDLGTLPQKLLGSVNIEVAPGVTGAQLGNAVKGPLTLKMVAGSIVPDAQLPLTDPKPIQTILDHCSDLLPPMLIAPGASAGACKIAIPNYGANVDVWIDGTTLHVGSKTPIQPKGRAELTRLGTELSSGDWTATMWGRGTTYANGATLGAAFAAIPEGQMVLRAMSLVNEVGVGVKIDGSTITYVAGVRTVWANPPDLVTKILAIPLADAMSPDSPAVKSVLASAPTSLFASDVVGGQGGLTVPMMGLGMLSAVAIPAFMDYMKPAKQSEANLRLNQIAKGAKVAFASTGAFPIGETPTTPAKPCCGVGADGQYDNKCHPTAADWADPAWQALDFTVEEPTMFQYKYTGTATSFQAFAIGDLDCDGVPAIWQIDGALDPQGNPQTQVTPPPKGQY